MNCQMPQNLERADPRDRTFPPSWKDAAIRALYDQGVKCQGVNCSHGERVFFGGNQLRMLQADHIIPWSLGGLTTWENLQLLCGSCNLAKSNHVLEVEGV